VALYTSQNAGYSGLALFEACIDRLLDLRFGPQRLHPTLAGAFASLVQAHLITQSQLAAQLRGDLTTFGDTLSDVLSG
jgi:hypothetical protein